MAIAGLRGTGDWGTDERPKNFRETILFRNPNGKTPIFAMMARMKKESTNDPEFSWWEEEQQPTRLQVSDSFTAGETTLTVNTSSYDAQVLVAGDLLLVQGISSAGFSNEIVEVSSTPSASNQFSVTRGAAGTSAGSISTDDYLTKIGSVNQEGNTAPDSTTQNPTKYFNYTQIFRTSYEITETTKNTRARTGDALKNDKKRRMFDHSAALEYAILFGKKSETTGANGKPKRTTGGLLEFLSDAYSNYSHVIKIYSSLPNEDTLLDDLYKLFDWDAEGAGDERIGIAGNKFLNDLNKIANDASSTRINFDGTVTQFGMNLQKWILPQGTLFIKSHPLMNTDPLFNKGCFFIHGSGMIWRPLQNRDTKPRDNIQNKDEDLEKGEWLTEAGVEFHHMPTMAYVQMP